LSSGTSNRGGKSWERPEAPAVSPAIATLLALIALTYFWYGEAVGSARDEMSTREAWIIPLYMMAMLVMEGGMLLVLSRIGPRIFISDLPFLLLAASLFVVNFYSNFLGLFDPFLIQDNWVKVAVLAFAFAIALTVVSALNESRGMRLGVIVIAPLLLVGQYLFEVMSDSSDAAAASTPVQPDLSPAMTTDAATVRKVAFARRPNVYLFSFDALTSDSVAQQHLDLPPPLKYTESLVANGARLLPNAFADREPTRPSLNSVFALDIDWFDKLSDAERYAFFTGRRRSPLTEIFRHNGYRIQTMHRTNYFGRRQGPYVDFYGVAAFGSICVHIENPFAFLGYCTRRVRREMQQLLSEADQAVSGSPYLELVRQRIRHAARDGRPWLTVGYSLLPGHASRSHDHSRPGDRDAYRAQFLRNSEAAAAEIAAVFATLRDVDPGAIVLVFGDHGSLMSRGAALIHDVAFYVRDRHAIRMAIWPATACERNFDHTLRGGFVTVAMAVRAIVVCLAAGHDPVDGRVTYTLPYREAQGYERFLYEDEPRILLFPSIVPR